MKITKLVQSKHHDLVQVFADEEYVASITKDTIISFSLYADKIITAEEWDKILREDILQKLYYQAIKQISARPRSVYEISRYVNDKLKLKLTDETIISKLRDEIINKLTDKNYLNDTEFCHWWIENRNAFKGKSNQELRMELRQKGIDTEIINSELSKLSQRTDQSEILKQIINKKYRLQQLPKDKKELQKIYSYLLRRGFDYDLIRSALPADD